MLSDVASTAQSGLNSGLNVIQSGRSYLDTLANRYIVKPKTVQGLGGYVFDYEDETSITLQADITEHFAEDNTVLNDNRVVKPLRITLRGFVGELVFRRPQGVLGALASLQNKLSVVPAYLGKYTPQALNKVQAALTKSQDIVNQVDQGIAKAKNLVALLGGGVGPDNQTKAYNYFEALHLSGQIFLVETPYKVFSNMVIENVTARQSAETKLISDFSVTFKQLRFVEAPLTTATQDRYGGRAAQQAQPQANNGQTKGTPAPVSLLKRIGSAVAGS